MRLETMRYFILVAEKGSIRGAAEELFISNQGLSQSLQQLETEVGTPLLYRHGKRLRLTAAGGVFLDYARRITALDDELRESLKDFPSGTGSERKTRLTLYVTPIVSQTFLSNVLSIFHKRFIGYPFSINEVDAERLLSQVDFDQNSIGILQAPGYLIEKSASLRRGAATLREVGTMPLLITASAHSLLFDEKEYFSAEDLRRENLSLYGHEAKLAEQLLGQSCTQQIVFNSANLLLCREYTSNSNSVGFSNSVVEKYIRGPHLKTVPFEPQLDLYTACMYNASIPLNPVLKDLIYIIQAELAAD